MRRLADLLPAAAARLGIEEELQQALAMSAWERIVAEHVPSVAGRSRLIGRRGDALLVSAPSSAVAAELRLRAGVLLGAMATAPGGMRARELQVSVRQAVSSDRRSGGIGGSGTGPV
ncbi:MAG: DciA family protein [Candidatus Limnocylindrales bacterium]